VTYQVLGKEIEIRSMRKPEGCHGSIFEFTGDVSALGEIGLKEKFYYSTTDAGRFTNELKPGTDTYDLLSPQNDKQRVLAIFLRKCIHNRVLSDQYAPPDL